MPGRFNTIVYNSLLTVCESAGEWHSCIRVLNEMEAAGVSPDYASLRITLNALASANKLQVRPHTHPGTEHQSPHHLPNPLTAASKGVSRLSNALPISRPAYLTPAPLSTTGDHPAARALLVDHPAPPGQLHVPSRALGLPPVQPQEGPAAAQVRRHPQPRPPQPPPLLTLRVCSRNRERQRLVAPEWIESRVYKSVLVSLGFRADCETALEVLAMVPPAQRDISIVCATVSVLLRREDMRENVRHCDVTDSGGWAYRAQRRPAPPSPPMTAEEAWSDHITTI